MNLQRKMLLGEALQLVKSRSTLTTWAYKHAVSEFVRWCQTERVEPNINSLGVYFGELRRQRRSASFLNQRLYGLKAAFRQAAERQGATVREIAFLNGALQELKGIKITPHPVKVISPHEREKLFKALPQRRLST